MTATSWVGAPQQRADAHAKVTGSLRYAVDLELPGMAEAAVLRIDALANAGSEPAEDSG